MLNNSDKTNIIRIRRNKNTKTNMITLRLTDDEVNLISELKRHLQFDSNREIFLYSITLLREIIKLKDAGDIILSKNMDGDFCEIILE